MIASEDVPAWKATLTAAHPQRTPPNHPRVIEAARNAAGDADPMVRSAGAQVLATVPRRGCRGLRPLLNDSSRLVRLDAAWPLSAETAADGSPNAPGTRLRTSPSAPTSPRAGCASARTSSTAAAPPTPKSQHAQGRRMGSELRRDSGRPRDRAERTRQDDLRRPPPRSGGRRSLDTRPRPASRVQRRARVRRGGQVRRTPSSPCAKTLRRNARYDRAWYNLGLLLAQTARAPEAVAALQTSGATRAECRRLSLRARDDSPPARRPRRRGGRREESPRGRPHTPASAGAAEAGRRLMRAPPVRAGRTCRGPRSLPSSAFAKASADAAGRATKEREYLLGQNVNVLESSQRVSLGMRTTAIEPSGLAVTGMSSSLPQALRTLSCRRQSIFLKTLRR